MSEPAPGQTWVTNVEKRALRDVRQAKTRLDVLRSTTPPGTRKPSARTRAGTRYDRAARHIADLERSLERATRAEARRRASLAARATGS